MTSRNKPYLSKAEWTKHIDCLKGLSILAHQASEYEYNKNRTEGKTGIPKPDSKSTENLSVSPKNTSTPIKSSPISPQVSEAPTEILVSPKRKISTISNSIPIKSPGEASSPIQSPKKVEPTEVKVTEGAKKVEEPEDVKKFIIDTPKKLTVPKTVPKPAKPPNILIYSDESSGFDSTLKTLKEVLEPDM